MKEKRSGILGFIGEHPFITYLIVDVIFKTLQNIVDLICRAIRPEAFLFTTTRYEDGRVIRKSPNRKDVHPEEAETEEKEDTSEEAAECSESENA